MTRPLIQNEVLFRHGGYEVPLQHLRHAIVKRGEGVKFDSEGMRRGWPETLNG